MADHIFWRTLFGDHIDEGDPAPVPPGKTLVHVMLKGNANGRVTLVAVDPTTGKAVPAGNLLTIYPNGRVALHDGVTDAIPLTHARLQVF